MNLLEGDAQECPFLRRSAACFVTPLKAVYDSDIGAEVAVSRIAERRTRGIHTSPPSAATIAGSRMRTSWAAQKPIAAVGR